MGMGMGMGKGWGIGKRVSQPLALACDLTRWDENWGVFLD